MKHEVVGYEEQSLFNSGHSYADGFDRLRCSCGWLSAADKKHSDLILLWQAHKKEHTPTESK